MTLLKNTNMKPPWLCCVFYAGILTVMLTSLQPLPQWLDSAELTLGATHLAISHPPGQPFFCMFMHMAQFVPLGTAPLMINVISIVALIASFVLILNSYFLNSRQRLCLLALSPMMLLAFSSWMQVLRQEVYVVNLLFFSLAFFLFSRIYVSSRACVKELYLLAFISGLSFANHSLLTVTQILPLALLAAYAVRKRGLRLGHVSLWCLFFSCLGTATYLYLPFRAANEPVINFGIPDRWSNFWWVLTGEGYSSYSGIEWTGVYENLVSEMAIVMQFCSGLGVLIMLGGWLLFWYQQRKQCYLFGIITFCCFFSLLPNQQFYLDNPDAHGYILPGLWLFVVVGTLGVASQVKRLPFDLRGVHAIALAFLIFAVLQTWRSWRQLEPWQQPDSDRFAFQLLEEVPAYNNLILGSFTTYSILRYFQVSEAMRQEVAIHYRGWPNFYYQRHPLPKADFVELAIAKRNGEYGTRMPKSQLALLAPAGWFFRSKQIGDQPIGERFAQQQRYWQRYFSRDSFKHPMLKRHLSLNHYLHGYYYDALEYPAAAKWEFSQAQLTGLTSY